MRLTFLMSTCDIENNEVPAYLAGTCFVDGTTVGCAAECNYAATSRDEQPRSRVILYPEQDAQIIHKIC